MSRHWVYKHYWWVALVVGGILVSASLLYGGGDRVGLAGAVVAGALGFCYFAVQQKLAEIQLFHELFIRFNERYDVMNGKLSDILERESDLTSEQRKLVVDYFNLCAEEFLFYKEGYIPPDVWRSWCRGMAAYLQRHPFRDIWNEEVIGESFYGLTKEKIFEGAGLRGN